MIAQVIGAALFYTWLVVTAFFLWRIQRDNAHARKAQQVLTTVLIKNAETAQKAVDAAYILAAHLKEWEAP